MCSVFTNTQKYWARESMVSEILQRAEWVLRPERMGWDQIAKGMDAGLRKLWFNKLLEVMGKLYTRKGILSQSSSLESLSLEHCKLWQWNSRVTSASPKDECSIAVMKQLTKKQVEGKVYLPYTSTSQLIIKGSQDRNLSRVGTWRQELILRPWRVAAYFKACFT